MSASRCFAPALFAAAIGAGWSTAAQAQDARYDGVVINELFFDPPKGDVYYDLNTAEDSGREYIELRGTPGMSLDNYYLLLTENENTTGSGNNQPGNIDAVFDLSDMTIGTNGYLLLLPRNFDRAAYAIAPGTAVYQNTGSVAGFGSGAGSTIGASDQGGDGIIENGGFSALLIQDLGGDGNAPPSVNFALDPDRDAIIGPTQFPINWTIHDSVAQNEPSEPDAYTYAAVTFTATAMESSHITPGGVNVYTDLEPEHLFRAGTSIGSDPEDWFVANLTDNTSSNGLPYPDGTSYDFDTDFAEYGFINSGPHTSPYTPGELVRGAAVTDQTQPGERNWAPEGTVLQNSLGRANFPIADGDLNQDGIVAQEDLDIVLLNWGQSDTNFLGYWLFGDPSGDGLVAQEDLDSVLLNWGRTAGGWVFTDTGMIWQSFYPTDLDDASVLAAAPDFSGFDTSSVDLSALASSPWAQNVPEPATLALMTMTCLTTLTRRRSARR